MSEGMKGNVTYSIMSLGNRGVFGPAGDEAPSFKIPEGPWQIIKTTAQEDGALVSEVIGGFDDRETAVNFCRVWNGDTNK